MTHIPLIPESVMLPIMIVVGVLTTVAFLILRVAKGGLPAMYCKTGASMTFILTAFLAMSYAHLKNPETFDFYYCVFMIVGLIFSMLGDIWLDLKYVYLEDQNMFLYSGFISFMAGHFFFVFAILWEYAKVKLWYIGLAAGICLVIVVGMLLLEKPMGNDYGKFRPILGVYTFFVSMTVVVSVIGLFVNDFSRNSILLCGGAVSFFLSDLVLSSVYFKEGGNTRSNVIVNHTLYYLAQFCFAASLLPLPLFFKK
ncbi:MAG: lysoplasmalogenase [Clostridiales bacterium]|nr:lysoplasmalogenase [Clostridiales bacterium]